jgi:hypothetical protein
MPAAVGPRLNDEWRIGARQSLYSRHGTWFHRLLLFPAALCDECGYIRFDTEAAYLNHPNIKVGKQTNVRNGISHLPEYVRVQH